MFLKSCDGLFCSIDSMVVRGDEVDADFFRPGEHRQIYSIRSMRDASVGIPWMGSGAAGKAVFVLVREVSVVVVMVPGPGGGYYS